MNKKKRQNKERAIQEKLRDSKKAKGKSGRIKDDGEKGKCNSKETKFEAIEDVAD